MDLLRFKGNGLSVSPNIDANLIELHAVVHFGDVVVSERK